MQEQPNIQGRKIRGLFALVGLNVLAFGATAEQLRFDFTRGSKPSKCPYCQSKRITAHMGLAECRDCGREWGY